MNIAFGRLSDQNTHRRRLAILVTSTVTLMLSGPLNAREASPLTVAEAERIALADEPGRQALEAGAQAMDERSAVSRQLPDPMLRFGVNNFPIESGGFSTEGMTHAAIGVRQMFPAAGTRAINERLYRELAGELNENAAARTRHVLLAVRQAWLDLYYWGRAEALVADSRPFFEELATITRSLYAVGRKNQQDVLHAELELSRLNERLIDIEQQSSVARARLSEWLGEEAARPLAGDVPAWPELPELGMLESQVKLHPSLRAADARIAAQHANVDLASRRSKPDWALDLGYSYREGLLPDGTPRSDFVSVMVTVDLPMFSKRAVDGTLTAALREQTAAEARRAELERKLTSELAAEHARWRDMSRRLSLYDAQILGQAKAQAVASLNAYQSDRGDFADVMRAYIDDLNTRIDHVRLLVERDKSHAALISLGGIEQ